MKEKESIWWKASEFHIHFLWKPTWFSVNDIFKRDFLLLTVCFTQQLKPEPIKVIETTQWALKCTIIPFNKACPVFFIPLKPNTNSNVTIWIAETVNSFVAKVIWKTAICGIYWNTIKCIRHFAYVTYSQRGFLENNHGPLLSWGKSQ